MSSRASYAIQDVAREARPYERGPPFQEMYGFSGDEHGYKNESKNVTSW